MRIHKEFLAVIEAFYYLFLFWKNVCLPHIWGTKKNMYKSYNEKIHVNAERQGCSTSSWLDLTWQKEQLVFFFYKQCLDQDQYSTVHLQPLANVQNNGWIMISLVWYTKHYVRKNLTHYVKNYLRHKIQPLYYNFPD